jgi:hypothetical protein
MSISLVKRRHANYRKFRDVGKRLKPDAGEAALADAALAAYEGRDLIGVLLEIDGTFHAFDLTNRCIGVFASMGEAARALPDEGEVT